MAKSVSEWWLYIIKCADESLYTGVTTDVQRRYSEHLSGGCKAAKYCKGRGPLQLVFTAMIGSRSKALQAEIIVKNCSRKIKQRIIAEQGFFERVIYDKLRQ